jgi:hypothetical protein
MAFIRTDLSLMASSGGNNLWFYRTADAFAAVDTADYFLTGIDQLNLGDIVFVYAGVGGTAEHGIAVINSNTGTAIDIPNITDLDGTDTD